MKEPDMLDKYSGILTPYVIGVGAALIFAGIFLALLGFNPIQGYTTILFASFGTATGFSVMLLKFIPLLLLSLAFSIPLKAKKYNVGNEGQFLLGAIGAVSVAMILGPLPWYLAWLILPIAGVLFGIAWTVVPAFLLYKFNVNEVISTIAMNFISYQLVDLVALGPWRDPMAGQPTTNMIPSVYQLPFLLPSLHVSLALIVAVAAPILAFYYMYKSVYGYELRSTGANLTASYAFGVKTSLLAPLSLVIGGAAAGLAGSVEVAGFQLRLIEGMQLNYGVLSVIIALVADGHPIGLVFVTILIAVIEVGSNAMQRTMGAPGALVYVVEALILLFVLTANVYKRRQKR